MKWIDVTSYSRGEARSGAKAEPRSWHLGEHRTGILVHRHIALPGAWFLSCYTLGIEQLQLANLDQEKAKKEAVEEVALKLRALVSIYKKLGVKL